jgi:hypothetical protein
VVRQTGDKIIFLSPILRSFQHEILHFIDRLADQDRYESYGFFMASPGFFMASPCIESPGFFIESPCIESAGFFIEAPGIALADLFMARPRLLFTRLFLRAIFVADTVVSLGVVTDIGVWVAAA